MTTRVEYADVDLENVLTNLFEQTPIREPSGTDILYQQFRVHVSTIVNLDATTMGIVAGGGNSVGERIERIRKSLAEDRKLFKFFMNGYLLLQSSAAEDSDNGPKVQRVNISRIAPATVHIDFEIIVARVDCKDYDRSPTQVISNRWACTDDVGKNFATTRTWRGQLRVSDASVDPQKDYRKLVMPPLIDGWQRVRMNFVTEPNGLVMGYEITDRELAGDAPPEPACRMSFRHSAAFPMEGTLVWQDFHVHLQGIKQSDRQRLIERAAQVAFTKLELDGWNSKSGGTIHSLAIVDNYDSDSDQYGVDCHVRISKSISEAEKVSPNVPVQLGNTPLKTMGKPLVMAGYDRTKTVNLGHQPSDMTTMFAAHLQSPCKNNHSMPQPNSSPSTPIVTHSEGSPPPEVTYRNGYVPEIKGPAYSPEHIEKAYTYYKIQCDYNVHSNIGQFPIAGNVPAGKPTAVCIQFGNPTAQKIIKVEAERCGEWPQLWNTRTFRDLNGIEHTMLKFRPSMRFTKTGDGKTIRCIDAEYVYALDRSPSETDQWSTAAVPWLSDSSYDNAAPGSRWMADPAGAKGLSGATG